MRLRRMLAEGIRNAVATAGAAAVVVALALPLGAAAVSTFEDAARFDAAASTTFAFDDRYTVIFGRDVGVEWMLDAGFGQEGWFQPVVSSHHTTDSGSHFVRNRRGLPLDRYSDLGLRFTTPETSVGVLLAPLGTARPASALSISVLTGGGELFELEYDLPAPGSPSFLGFTDSTGIVEVRWQVANGGYFGIADLTVGSVLQQVPEPGTAALLGLGLAGLGAAARRRPGTTRRSRFD